MVLTPSGVNACPRRGRVKAASPLVSCMPILTSGQLDRARKRQGLGRAAAGYRKIPRAASARDTRSPHAIALKQSTCNPKQDSVHIRKRSGPMAPAPVLITPLTFIADLNGNKDRCSTPGPERTGTAALVAAPARGVDRDDLKRSLLAQFRFQPFKKCFRLKCLTIFVPGDFKPSSPRRMFCSKKCFEEHWREKLSRYLEKTLPRRVQNGYTK